jgi:hypothetical protein
MVGLDRDHRLHNHHGGCRADWKNRRVSVFECLSAVSRPPIPLSCHSSTTLIHAYTPISTSSITLSPLFPNQDQDLRRTQRPIEPSHPIHILSGHHDLLLPHPIQFIIPRHFGILRRFELAESHHLFHLSLECCVGICCRVSSFSVIHIHV